MERPQDVMLTNMSSNALTYNSRLALETVFGVLLLHPNVDDEADAYKV